MHTEFDLCRADRFHVRAKLDTDAATFHLACEGDFHEGVRLGPLFDYLSRSLIPIGMVSIDTSGIQAINSAGVREWLWLVEKLTGAKIPLRFARVGEIFLDVANHLPNMFGGPGVPVDSFAVPYSCPSCEDRVVKYLSESSLARKESSVAVPRMTCEKCGKGLVFDEVEKEYFSFLNRSSQPRKKWR